MAVLGFDGRLAIADGWDFPSAEALADQRAPTDGVSIQEWRTYYLRCYAEEVPPELLRAPFLTRVGPSIFEANFRNHVGLTRLGGLKIHVENRKIGEGTWHALLDYVADRYADLVFAFDTPTGYNTRRTAGAERNNAYVQYLFLKRHLLDARPGIRGLLNLILAEPHHRLEREQNWQPVWLAGELAPASIGQLLQIPDCIHRLPASHPLTATPAGRALARWEKGLFPTRVLVESRYRHLDTSENRFIKHVLEELRRLVGKLAQVFQESRGTYLNPELKEGLDRLEHELRAGLGDPLWREVGPLNYIPEHSPVLHRRDGYKQLFRLNALLRRVSRYDFSLPDFADLIESKDTATLFEYWAFFVTKEILDDHLGKPIQASFLSRSDRKTEVSSGVALSYPNGVSLSFQSSYGGSSGLSSADQWDAAGYAWGTSASRAYNPDLLILKDRRRLVLDAKYKGQDGGFYGEEVDGSIFRWKDADIDKMHTYREAIAGVEGAYAVYPGRESKAFPTHGAREWFQGVGAVALRPAHGEQPEPERKDFLVGLVQDFLENRSATSPSGDRPAGGTA